MFESPLRRMARAVRKRWHVAAVALLITAVAAIAMCGMRASEDRTSPELGPDALIAAHDAVRAAGTDRG